MHFEGVFTVASPKKKVFAVVTDPNQVARCMPDLRRLEVKSKDEFVAVVGTGISLVKGNISLHFRTVEKTPSGRTRMVAHGDGLGSAIDVEMVTELTDGSGGGTAMKWTAEAKVSGKLASLGQGLIKSQSERIIRQLFDCLRSRLE
ncbi:MAG: carbon monoxide dehydrogenase subunit G [Nitrososphaerota archaeon]|nr:carbon monoxide dehydrogenase subunit G [Nitrososphaerota archaeon]MDG7024893.1 carbon monoxide dehydrogenase subunit G [Nitrososphaerota archaeon]